MDVLLTVVQTINNYLSNYILIILLIGTGLVFTIRTRFVQVRCFGEGLKRMFGNFSLRGGKQKSGMSSFQALATAVAAQVGTGNIVGACGAILVGGPARFFGCGSSPSWACRRTTPRRFWLRRPASSMRTERFTAAPSTTSRPRSKGRSASSSQGFFAVAIILALGFMGCMVQSNSIASTCNTAFGIPTWVMGAAVVLVGGFIFLGGVSRIASVTEKIVPIMAIVYLLGGVAVLVANGPHVLDAFALIFECAFNPEASIGGVTFGIIAALSQGAKRGLFSNEAGMGSTPHAHALANVKNPHDQGVVAMIAVFVDTFVVVTITALVTITVLYTGDGLLAQGLYEGVDKTNMAQIAFASLFGENLGAAFVAICLLFFAFSTIISWNLFAKINVEYLFGKKAVPVFTVIALAFIFLGSLLSNELVWGSPTCSTNSWSSPTPSRSSRCRAAWPCAPARAARSSN